MEETGHVPEDDDENAEARGLEALNQMDEELQVKRVKLKPTRGRHAYK